MFCLTTMQICLFSGINAEPACSNFGDLKYGMDAPLQDFPLSETGSPDPRCYQGSPVTVDLDDGKALG